MPDDKIYGYHLDKDPRIIIEQYAILGERSAAAMAKFQYLTDCQKVLLAEVKLEKWETTTTESGKKISLDLAETMALASAEYKQHVEKVREAREQSYGLQNQFKSEDKYLELLRSLESSAKAQLNKLGA